MKQMFEFPRRVTIQAVGPSPEGIVVGLNFEMKSKNNFSYTLSLGPDGFAEICADELLDSFYGEQNESPMDYMDPRTGFTGRVTANIKSNAELREAIKAYRMLHEFCPYPAKYEERLLAAVQRGQDPKYYELQLQIEY